MAPPPAPLSDYGPLLPPGPPGAVVLLGVTADRFEVTPVTQGVAEFLEFSCDELAARLRDRTLPLLDPEGDGPAFYASIERALARGGPWEAVARFLRPVTGATRWIHAHALPVPGDRPRWTVHMIDVTAARGAADELERAQQKYRRYVENTPLAVIEWDAGLRVLDWSARAEELFGWRAGEVLGLAPADWPLVHPDDRDRIGEVCDDLVAGAPWRGVVRNRNLTKDGRTLHCEWYNSVLADDDGRVTSILSLVQDVSARTAALEAAGRSEERLREALSMAGMIGWNVDLRTNEAHFSGDNWRFHGVEPPPGPPPGALEFYECSPTMHPDDRAAARATIAPTLGPGGGEFRVQYRNPAGDRWFVARGRTLPGPSGRPERIVGVNADVTGQVRAERDRDEAERLLDEARRLESLALLAGGVAHDLNNLLTVILGNAELLRTQVAAGPPQESLDEIERAVHRAAELARQITAYAGTGRVKVHSLDLNALLAESADALRAAAGPAAELTLCPAAAALSAHADPAQVRQLLFNLVRNAGEALAAQGGGPLSVELGETEVAGPADAAGFVPEPRPGRYAAIRVRDGGGGFDPAMLAKLFQPYVSTKGFGRGLGLAAAAGIVRAHRGAIRVESAPGEGASVTVILPRGADPAPAGPAPAPRPAGALALVVDDEPNIRELAAATLEDEGYRVVAAADGAAGWAAFAARPGDFALAVIDLQLPDGNGADVLRRLRSLRPELPAVVITGYTTRELPPDLSDHGGTAVLMKPFPLEELAALARTLAPAR